MLSTLRFLSLSLMLLSFCSQANEDIRDTKSLEAFLDGIVKTTMDDSHIAGAVVAVMVDGKVTVKKGYGYADVERKLPVDPDKTLFRIGSVTKLFTYMSLMQLHEQGKLDLNADIQQYLPNLDIPKTFDTPIRVINLFTHTAGFEDRVIGLFGKDESSAQPYVEVLQAQLPERVRKPGLVSSYSNHSLGIAGLIIENVSGMSWAAYVQKNILDPLGMEYATAYQPVPDQLAAHSSVGYRWINNAHVPQAFEYVPLGAAGTMSVSANAMMKFMAANLNGGVLDTNRVIGEATLAQMQTRLYAVHPSLNAWMYGYAESSVNGIPAFGHNGGTLQFFTNFVMIPETSSGLFVSTNTTGGGKLLGAVFKGLTDRYYPVEPQITPLDTPSDISGFAGSYSTYRHPVTTPAKLLRMESTVQVLPGAEPGHLQIISSQGPQTAIEVEPMVFQIENKSTRVFFDIDKNGQKRMFIGSAGGSFYKLGLTGTMPFQRLLLIFSMVLMVWALIAWPIQKMKSSRLPSNTEHRSRLAFWWFSAVTMGVSLGIVLNTSEDVVFGLPSSLILFLNLAYLVPITGLLSVIAAVRLLPDSGTEVRIRCLHAAMGLAAISVCWLFYYWNLIGSP
jgi:CubicO group peptidase (beta-lactamase class C family)